MVVNVPNQSRVYFARYGYYAGGKYTFSHRDPQTGDLWGEDIPVGKNPVEYGKWVPGDQVRLIWTDEEGHEVVEPQVSNKKKRRQNRGRENRRTAEE